MWSAIQPNNNNNNSNNQRTSCQEKKISHYSKSISAANENDNHHENSVDNADTNVAPIARYKHASCGANDGHIYIHGGRIGNVIDDHIWRYDPRENVWCKLTTYGGPQPTLSGLQEHTMVEWQHKLYIFGGQIGGASDAAPFWQLDLATKQWRNMNDSNDTDSNNGIRRAAGATHLGPSSRRAHTACKYRDSMFIFGGYEDLRGSSGQLWEFNFNIERWHLTSLDATSSVHPLARHSHAAVVYRDDMWVHGGLSDLQPLSDLWRWSWRQRRWTKCKTKGRCPGQLHGHSAIEAFGSMFVFGGERNGVISRSLWRLNFDTLTWQKIQIRGLKPYPITWHTAIANPTMIVEGDDYIVDESSVRYLNDDDEHRCNAFAFDQHVDNQHVHLRTSQSAIMSSELSSRANSASRHSGHGNANDNHLNDANDNKIDNNKNDPGKTSSLKTSTSKSMMFTRTNNFLRRNIHRNNSNSINNDNNTNDKRISIHEYDKSPRRPSKLSFFTRKKRPVRPRSAYDMKAYNQNNTNNTSSAGNTLCKHRLSFNLHSINNNKSKNNDKDKNKPPPCPTPDYYTSDCDENTSNDRTNQDDSRVQMMLDRMETSEEGQSGSGSESESESSSKEEEEKEKEKEGEGEDEDQQMTRNLSNNNDVEMIDQDQQEQEQSVQLRDSSSVRVRPKIRPQSEIVQSLIDNADARIYNFNNNNRATRQSERATARTNHTNNNNDMVNVVLRKREHHSSGKHTTSSTSKGKKDLSKRHTIHQSMYYNLYFPSPQFQNRNSGNVQRTTHAHTNGNNNDNNHNSSKSSSDKTLTPAMDEESVSTTCESPANTCSSSQYTLTLANCGWRNPNEHCGNSGSVSGSITSIIDDQLSSRSSTTLFCPALVGIDGASEQQTLVDDIRCSSATHSGNTVNNNVSTVNSDSSDKRAQESAYRLAHQWSININDDGSQQSALTSQQTTEQTLVGSRNSNGNCEPDNDTTSYSFSSTHGDFEEDDILMINSSNHAASLIHRRIDITARDTHDMSAVFTQSAGARCEHGVSVDNHRHEPTSVDVDDTNDVSADVTAPYHSDRDEFQATRRSVEMRYINELKHAPPKPARMSTVSNQTVIHVHSQLPHLGGTPGSQFSSSGYDSSSPQFQSSNNLQRSQSQSQSHQSRYKFNNNNSTTTNSSTLESIESNVDLQNPSVTLRYNSSSNNREQALQLHQGTIAQRGRRSKFHSINYRADLTSTTATNSNNSVASSGSSTRSHLALTGGDSGCTEASVQSPNNGSISSIYTNNGGWWQPNIDSIRESVEVPLLVLKPALVACQANKVKPEKKNPRRRYWHLCMFVMGGRDKGNTANAKDPISIWKLYI